MSSHGLGIEGAARALTVSKALQRETTEQKVSLSEAIDNLTSKLSVANLICIDCGSPSPAPTIPCDSDSLPRRPSDVRIQPVLALPHKATTTSTISSTNSTALNVPAGRKSKTSKQKHGNGSRKRAVDDISSTNHPTEKKTSSKKEEATNSSNFTTRERSDSLSEVVSAKFGGEADDTSTSVRTGSLPSPVVVRAKHGRVDDGESSQNALKRSRAASDL